MLLARVTVVSTHLNGRLESLHFDGEWLPDSQLPHVCEDSLVPVNTPRHVTLHGMLCLGGLVDSYIIINLLLVYLND